MNDNNTISGISGTSKMIPLISFHTLVDSDFGLINLVYDKYLDNTVFNVDYFKDKEIENIIIDLYYRKEENPLYLIAKNNIGKELLDKYYKEFIETKRKDIYNMSINTNIVDLINIFDSDKDIIPYILYYNDDQLDILNNEPLLKDIKKVSISELLTDSKNLDIYSAFFFKKVSELELFKDLRTKSFYISTYRFNFDDNGNFKDEKFIKSILYNNNRINIFDLYNNQVLRKEIQDNDA